MSTAEKAEGKGEVKVKGRPGRPPGRRNNPALRGQIVGKPRTQGVLNERDEPIIIDELRRFQPLCAIAAKLNVARSTVERYVHSHPHLQRELDDRDESMIDMTQRALWDASIGNVKRDSNGKPVYINVNAATFLLERLGKSRGFSQHIEVEQAEVPTFTFTRRDGTVQE